MSGRLASAPRLGSLTGARVRLVAVTAALLVGVAALDHRAVEPTSVPSADAGAPVLSAPTGFYDGPFELEVWPPGPQETVWYTLDGSFPEPNHNPATRRYDEPIAIVDRSGPPRLALVSTTITDPAMTYFQNELSPPPDLSGRGIEQATVVRARTASGPEVRATYFVGPDRLRPQLPVVSLLFDPDHLFDEDTGIYVPGETFASWRASDAFDPEARWQTPANYRQRGRQWERPTREEPHRTIAFQLCWAGGDCAYERDVGVRIHGAFSRTFPRKSLRLYARADGGFSVPVFGSGAPVGHRTLLLRNSGNDHRRLGFVDGFLQSLMGPLSADTQAYEPAVLFLDGEYWGIHNLRERHDEALIALRHGVPAEEVELLDNTSLELVGTHASAVADWRNLLERVATLDPTDDELVSLVDAEVDLDSFYDVVIAHVFSGNADWVSNNMRWWRVPSGPGGPGGPMDGRWRWLVSDLDQMGGNVAAYDADFDPLTGRLAATDDLDEGDGYPFLFAHLTANPTLRERFLDRFADHLDTTFRPTRTVPALETLRERLEDEMARHVERWQTASMEEWHGWVDELAAFLEARPEVQRRQLAERFGVDGTVQLEVRHDPEVGQVAVGTVRVREGVAGVDDPARFTTTRFRGVPVELEATPRDGTVFVGWRDEAGELIATDRALRLRPGRDLRIDAEFAPTEG